MDKQLEKLRFPVGRYQTLPEISAKQIGAWIIEIAALPSRLRIEVKGLSDVQLDTHYRPGGWTLRQVIHHLPESHMNAYIRFKLAITEDNPIVRPYFEDRWAECEDAKAGPVDVSLDLLDSLHKRWVLFLKTLKISDFERTFTHPEHQKSFKLKDVVGMYAWHGLHHLAHISETKKNNNW